MQTDFMSAWIAGTVIRKEFSEHIARAENTKPLQHRKSFRDALKGL